ncbi:MAG: hypothetical protein CW338_06415, partial [Clostridiales bacterium]|nr:hypothetical protein [Clostridiales bacterium]
MTFARLRKVAILCIVLMLAGLIPVCAGAAGLETKTSATPAEIKNFGEQVTVSIEITNNTGAAIGPVTLLDPDDKPVAAFGENGSAMLAAGEKIAVEDVHAVTEKEAGAKNIVYKMRYSDVNEDGEVVSIVKKVNIPVSFNGTVVQLTAEREISAGAARKGDTFLIVYTLTNTGTVDIKDIKVSETATKKVETVSGTLKPGEQKKVSFMVSMGGSDMISSATITFRANDEAQTTTVGEQVIRFGEPNLSLIVSCDDRDVIIGGTAQLKITFENKGTISYSNITVKDEKAGVLLEGRSVDAGETQTYT